MKVIRSVDTFAHHCQKYYGVTVDAPQSKPRKTRKFDPTNWKNNDLYAMLGLEDKRMDATLDDIRNAYRQAVLVHHPDKQAQRSAHNADDDSRFKVLQKAFTWLSDPERRQQYDSIDFDESIPKTKDYEEDEFWSVFPECFHRNAIFSIHQPVPYLSRQQTRAEVDHFYTFWFNFESWRRFEFLDEEDVEGGERAEKRWVEKKNKAARQKRKTEDNARITKLVELAYKNDPRVKAWKEEEKRAKEAKKQQQSVKKPPTPSSSPSPSSTKSSNNSATDLRRKEEQVKMAMAAANELKNQKKVIRALFSDNNYFSPDVKEMERVSLMLEQAILKMSLVDLKDLQEKIKADSTRAVSLLEATCTVSPVAVSATATTPTANVESKKHEWTVDQIDQLIRAVKLFPPGVPDRWHRISEHLNKSFPISHEQVLQKAEDMKQGKLEEDLSNGPATTVAAKKRDPRVDMSEPTILVREDIPNAAIDAPWTAEEQHNLEAAIKATPADVPDRWARIAELLPGRTKQQVLKRVKEIAERVKQGKK